MDERIDAQEVRTQLEQDPLRLAVLVGSVRKERIAHEIGGWVRATLTDADLRADLDLVDLAEVDLPEDELLQPGGGRETELSARLAAADAFVVVTPEYNAGIPARLKATLDWHYHEWPRKAAMVVSYGVQGGHLATQSLRAVFAELSVVTTRRYVALPRPWEQLGEHGFRPSDGTALALRQATDELLWWADALRQARRASPVAVR